MSITNMSQKGRNCILVVCLVVLLVAPPPDRWLSFFEKGNEEQYYGYHRRWLSCFESPLLLLKTSPQQKKNDHSNSTDTTGSDRCPAVIRQQQGIYRNQQLLPPLSTAAAAAASSSSSSSSTSSPTAVGVDKNNRLLFQNVVLLTAANQKFSRLLTNWEIIAREKGLKWVFLALDEGLYGSRGGGTNNTNLLISHDKQMVWAGRFRTESYNKLVCNKIRMVKDIMDDCNVEVVFSDVDNVFLQDPFQHDLGAMIASKQHDYIYQSNGNWAEEPRQHHCVSKGIPARTGNTGFHYLRPTRRMKELLQSTLEQCDHPDNILDDQTILWKTLTQSFMDKKWQHCSPGAYKEQPAPLDTVLDEIDTDNDDTRVGNFCCLDPHYYASGKIQPAESDNLVSLHANFISHIKAKERKLREWTTNSDGFRLPMPGEDRKKAEAAAHLVESQSQKPS